VVVVGSGAAGLAAALAAAGEGADVVVLERAAAVGGTTAMSGGVAWMPGHGRSSASAARDSAEEALAYLCGLARGDVDVELMRAFVSDAARVAGEIEARTPIEWEVLAHWPDYRGELPGASPGGRSMWPRPLRAAPSVEARVQGAFDQPSPAAAGPASTAGAPGDGTPANDGVVLRGHVRGRALCAGLLAGVLEAGVDVRTGVRAERLVTAGGAVTGVVAGGEPRAGRVVLASGGFQHDAALAATHLAGPGVAPMGPSGCAGDGLHMAEAAGAALANMAEGWWMPAMHVPGEVFDGTPHYRPLHGERAQPGAIMVDGAGRRFVDEAQNYGDVGRAMRRHLGAATPARAAVARATSASAAPGPDGPGPGPAGTGSCWLVFDAAYRRRYPVGPLPPGGADPAWLVRAPDIAGLARATGMETEVLENCVARFNAGAARGEDPEFGRGTYPYDRWIGDPGAPHPTLAPLDEAPFFALAVHLGCMGTKGGPRTDDRGRVLAPSGAPVPGLYAAGNAAASPFGTATAAGGATLGPALVFGFRAGEAAARDR
jgi:succinate dehydrogenase/fumarate reductase flavoprotein subunit